MKLLMNGLIDRHNALADLFKRGGHGLLETEANQQKIQNGLAQL